MSRLTTIFRLSSKAWRTCGQQHRATLSQELLQGQKRWKLRCPSRRSQRQTQQPGEKDYNGSSLQMYLVMDFSKVLFVAVVKFISHVDLDFKIFHYFMLILLKLNWLPSFKASDPCAVRRAHSATSVTRKPQLGSWSSPTNRSSFPLTSLI